MVSVKQLRENDAIPDMKAVFKNTGLPQGFQMICSDICLGTESVQLAHLILHILSE
jgi:hypothetical protein